MRLLEDQHWPQTNSLNTASTNVDTQALHALHQSCGIFGVERQVRSLTLTTQVHDMLWVLGGELLDLGIQLVADTGLPWSANTPWKKFAIGTYALINQILVQDLVDDCLAHDHTGWVANPGVELAVCLVRHQHAVSEEVPGGLGLLGESDDVRRRR